MNETTEQSLAPAVAQEPTLPLLNGNPQRYGDPYTGDELLGRMHETYAHRKNPEVIYNAPKPSQTRAGNLAWDAEIKFDTGINLTDPDQHLGF